jgi:hypothetical protein
MPIPTFQEFTDQNLHRAYPLTDDAPSNDTTGSFSIPTSLITDMYLCVPNIPEVDVEKFYIYSVLVRRYQIEISIGYDDALTPTPIGTFRGILVDAPIQSTYDFIPSKLTNGNVLDVLYVCTGQIIIGDASETAGKVGLWNFNPSETLILPTRIARGLLNVQYISVLGNYYTGVVKFAAGSGVELEVNTVGNETTITISATGDQTNTLLSDADVIAALTNDIGVPIRSINGLLPDANRNFNLVAEDCTELTDLAAGVSIGNPCATPCCEENANLTSIKESITNLNLKFADLFRFFEANRDVINDIQANLMVLGTTL